MERKVIIFLVLLFLIVNVSGSCEKGQIDINSASLEELDELYGIGLIKAEAIMNARPFDSVEDLIKVNGIGEITLEKIKEQGLACIDFEEEENIEKKEAINKNENFEISGNVINKEEIQIEKDTIFLEPKDIKTKINNDDERKINYPLFGLIFFCVLIGTLYLIKEKKYKKNEFKE